VHGRGEREGKEEGKEKKNGEKKMGKREKNKKKKRREGEREKGRVASAPTVASGRVWPTGGRAVRDGTVARKKRE
jgi:hypothetical protein